MLSALLTSRVLHLCLFVVLSLGSFSLGNDVPEKKTTLEIHLQPAAKMNAIAGFRDGVLYVKVTATPEKGKANKALVELMAETLGLPKNALKIIRGQTSRDKIVSVQGLTSQELMDMLARELPCKDFLHLAKG